MARSLSGNRCRGFCAGRPSRKALRHAARRRFISALAGFAIAPLLPARPAHALIDSLAGEIRKVVGGAPLREGKVTLEIPRLADNGHSVPLRISVESPMTPADHVLSITLLSEKNPRAVMAVFHLSARTGRAVIATRVRLATTQRLLAIAKLSDGSCWAGTAVVDVTESACLDES